MGNSNKAGPSGKLMLCQSLVFLLGQILCGTTVMSTGLPNETCIDCHDEVGEAFAQTPHGIFFSGQSELATYGCASCHGSGLEHVEEGGDPDLIINPARHDQFGSSELCLSCHKGHQFGEWSFSSHATAGVNCADCHTVHGSASESVKKAMPDLCYDCHSEVRAAAMLPSRHPIAEGKMQCQDCHSIHGEELILVQDFTGRELCFRCHAEKEGPFVFEHAPVNEDCMVCHTPHGSVANNLLKQNEPALCLNCHSMHFHATVESVDGDFEVPLDADRNGISSSDGWKSGFLTACTQCHTEIHGSDMPSQSISGSGSALTR